MYYKNKIAKSALHYRIYFYVKRGLDGPEGVVTASKRATFGHQHGQLHTLNKILKCITKTLI